MINITLPDNSVRQYPEGVTGVDIAKSISEGLARNVLSIKVNDEIWDAIFAVSDIRAATVVASSARLFSGCFSSATNCVMMLVTSSPLPIPVDEMLAMDRS